MNKIFTVQWNINYIISYICTIHVYEYMKKTKLITPPVKMAIKAQKYFDFMESVIWNALSHHELIVM